MQLEKQQDIWEERFDSAKLFYKEHRHLCPPPGALKTWIQGQRYKKQGKRGGLTDSQIESLESIGMDWNPLDTRWEYMYGLAQNYYQIHLKLNIPAKYTIDGERLGGWISKQRSTFKEGKMLPHRKEKLDTIGMIWDNSNAITTTSFQEQALYYYLKQHFSDVCKISQWEFIGYEIDIFLPQLKTGIEYDGYLHASKADFDEEKNEACRENGIRLIRIREPNLPYLKNCGETIELDNLSEDSFEQSVCELFEMLDIKSPKPDISRDRNSIYESYKDYASHRWDAIYEQVFAYYQKHGELPKRRGQKSDGGIPYLSWLNTQRRCYRAGELTSKQILKLGSLRFDWTPFKTQWNTMYEYALTYVLEYGDLMVPVTYVTPSGKNLGKWLSHQRELYLNGKLSIERIHQLEKLDIIWSPFDLKRDFIIESVKDYYRENGDIAVPPTYINEDGIYVGEWLDRQRQKYRQGTLDEKIYDQLTIIDATWFLPKTEAEWEKMYEVAIQHYNTYGSIWMTANYITPKGIRLGGWISKQRSKYNSKGRSKPLTPEQIEKLEILDMVWDPYEEKWMKGYEAAQDFYRTYGHLNIPVKHVTEQGIKLGQWLSCQRQGMQGNPNYRMTYERKNLLEEIGMDWGTSKAKKNKWLVDPSQTKPFTKSDITMNAVYRNN